MCVGRWRVLCDDCFVALTDADILVCLLSGMKKWHLSILLSILLEVLSLELGSFKNLSVIFFFLMMLLDFGYMVVC